MPLPLSPLLPLPSKCVNKHSRAGSEMVIMFSDHLGLRAICMDETSRIFCTSVWCSYLLLLFSVSNDTPISRMRSWLYTTCKGFLGLLSILRRKNHLFKTYIFSLCPESDLWLISSVVALCWQSIFCALQACLSSLYAMLTVCSDRFVACFG